MITVNDVKVQAIVTVLTAQRDSALEALVLAQGEIAALTYEVAELRKIKADAAPIKEVEAKGKRK